MITALTIGLIAGTLQAAAYLLYARFVIRCETRPNGMSWLMWAYGTFVFFFVEFDTNAPFSLLFLPAVCTLSAVLIALYSFYKSSYIPPERQDYIALVVDVTLMTTYLALLAAFGLGYLPELLRTDVGMIFLVLTSFSTLVTFYPIMRTTFESPRDENPLPWFMWTIAYSLLLYTVFLENIGWQYAIYPILNILLHGLIGVFALTDEERSLPWKRNQNTSPLRSEF